MTEQRFKKVFAQFLNKYWGAFHEALEAQSVTTPQRLARSFFETLRAEHHAFEGVYVGPAKRAIDGLAHIWHDVEERRAESMNPPLEHVEILKARQLFVEIYSSLLHQGERYPKACKEVLERAPHGTPTEPLRADAAY